MSAVKQNKNSSITNIQKCSKAISEAFKLVDLVQLAHLELCVLRLLLFERSFSNLISNWLVSDSHEHQTNKQKNEFIYKDKD